MRWLLSYAVVFALYVPGIALAQEAEQADDSVEAARVLYERGVEAAQAGDWAAAEQAFRASLAESYREFTAYNLAIALTELGRFTDAIEIHDRLLAGNDESLPRPRDEILADRARANTQRAVVEVLVTGADEATIRIDGAVVGVASPGANLLVPLDPGEHHLEATSHDRTVDARVTLRAGERPTVPLALPMPSLPPPTLEESQPTPSPAAQPDALDDSSQGIPAAVWWIGGSAIVVGAIATLVILVATSASQEPFMEEVPAFEALRAAR